MIEQYLDQQWEINSLNCLKFIAFLRNINSGMGQRSLGRQSLVWLAKKSPVDLINNLDIYVAKYGRFDDLVELVEIPNIRDHVLTNIKNKLLYDKDCLDNGLPVSTCAKWVPSEASSLDSKYKFNNLLAKHMKLTHKQLRILLGQLRKQIRIQYPSKPRNVSYLLWSYSVDNLSKLFDVNNYQDICLYSNQ